MTTANLTAAGAASAATNKKLFSSTVENVFRGFDFSGIRFDAASLGEAAEWENERTKRLTEKLQRESLKRSLDRCMGIDPDAHSYFGTYEDREDGYIVVEPISVIPSDLEPVPAPAVFAAVHPASRNLYPVS